MIISKKFGEDMKLTKWDMIFLIIVLALGIAGSVLVLQDFSDASYSSVVIEVNNQVYKEYKLSEDFKTTVEIKQENGEYNLLEIDGFKVRMIEANCKDKLCVHQGYLDHATGMIVCLPNHVVVRLVSDKEAETDAITY